MTDLKLTDIKGVGSVKAKLLTSHGINSVSGLMNSSVYELCLVPGINQTSANTLKSNVKQLLDNQKLLSGQSNIDKKITVSAKQPDENAQSVQSKPENTTTQDKKKDSKHKKKKQKDKKKDKKKKTKGKSKKKK
ncbi:MAG: helix-hairpin-helix domain-containing protein [Proteobacteria bacterium]|nr:helix-hairpin-helix domain-containing protein [Pseudomonadota bacterium]